MDYLHPISWHDASAKSAEKPAFSILIPTWDNLPLLRLCVESLRQHSALQHEIILHINEDKEAQTRRWAEGENIAYSYSAQNVGVCYAINAAARLAKADYICYFNDDMYALPHWDLPLWQAIQARADELFYYSATMIEPTETGNPCVLAPYDFGRSAEDFQREKLLCTYQKLPARADWWGASWPPSVVSRRLWEQVGGYDVDYSPGFGSDPDFSRRLWAAGVRDFRGLGASRVYHFQSKTTKKVQPNNARRSFARKWGCTISHFYRYALRMGQPVGSDFEQLGEMKTSLWARIRGFWAGL